MRRGLSRPLLPLRLLRLLNQVRDVQIFPLSLGKEADVERLSQGVDAVVISTRPQPTEPSVDKEPMLLACTPLFLIASLSPRTWHARGTGGTGTTHLSLF